MFNSSTCTLLEKEKILYTFHQVPFTVSHNLDIPRRHDVRTTNERRWPPATVATVGHRLGGAAAAVAGAAGVLNQRRNQSCHNHQRELPIRQTKPKYNGD